MEPFQAQCLEGYFKKAKHMVNEFLEDVILPRLTAITWMEHVAGLTNRVSRTSYDRDATSPKTIHFPVHCGTTGQDCYTETAQKMLAPDDSKMNVSFFEQISWSFGENNGRSKNSFFSLRFLFWANLAKMGVSGCSIPFPAIFQIVSALEANATNTPYNGTSVRTTVTGINTHDHLLAFGRYTFAQDEKLFFYPYSFAAFDLVGYVLYDPTCIAAFTPGTAIDCADIL